MLSRLLRFLCVSSCLVAAAPARASDIPPTVTWTFEDLKTLGGAPLEIWGAPTLKAEQGVRAVHFDGKADGLMVPIIPIADWKAFTIEILFSPDPDGLAEQRFLHLQDKNGRRVLIELRLLPDASWYLDTFLYSDAGHRLALIDRSKTHPAGRWHWAALTYADGKMAHFIDGVKECEGTLRFEPISVEGGTSIGVRQNKVYWYKGAIRQVRFTPEALSADKLQRAQQN